MSSRVKHRAVCLAKRISPPPTLSFGLIPPHHQFQARRCPNLPRTGFIPQHLNPALPPNSQLNCNTAVLHSTHKSYFSSNNAPPRLPPQQSPPTPNPLPPPPSAPPIQIEMPTIAESDYIRGTLFISVMSFLIVFAKISPEDGYESLVQLSELIELQQRQHYLKTSKDTRFGMKPPTALKQPIVVFKHFDYPFIDAKSPNYRQYYSPLTIFRRAISSSSQWLSNQFPSTFTPRFYIHPMFQHLHIYNPDGLSKDIIGEGDVCVISGDATQIDQDIINIQQYLIQQCLILTQYLHHVNTTLNHLERAEKNAFQFYLDRFASRFTGSANTFFSTQTYSPLNQYYSFQAPQDVPAYAQLNAIVQQYNKLLHDIEVLIGEGEIPTVDFEQFSSQSSDILTHPAHMKFDFRKFESFREIIDSIINQHLFMASKVIDPRNDPNHTDLLSNLSYFDKQHFLYGQGLNSIAQITSARYIVEGLLIQLCNYKALMKSCENSLWVTQNLGLSPLKRNHILDYIQTLPASSFGDEISDDDIQRLCDQFEILSLPPNITEFIFGSTDVNASKHHIQTKLDNKTKELMHLYTVEYEKNNQHQLDLLSDENYVKQRLIQHNRGFEDLQHEIFYALKIRREPLHIPLIHTYPQYFPSTHPQEKGLLASVDDLKTINPKCNIGIKSHPNDNDTLINFAQLKTTPPQDWGQFTYLDIPDYIPIQQQRSYYSIFGPYSFLNWLSIRELPQYSYGMLLSHISTLFDKVDALKFKNPPNRTSSSRYSDFISPQHYESLPQHPTYLPPQLKRSQERFRDFAL